MPLPALTIKSPTREAARENRREFERREGAIEFRLGRHHPGVTHPLINHTLGGAASIAVPFLKQAKNYIGNKEIRAQVLSTVLRKLPAKGRIAIVAHSLGSVIAADLLRRLPVDVEVTGMITIGSPLAAGSFDVDRLRETLTDPPTNLAWWVNFWNFADPVAALRGVTSVFPWLIDFRIVTGATPVTAHFAVEYLREPTVANAVGYAVFGSKSTELATVEEGVDTPLDAGEVLALLALRYAHLLTNDLRGDGQLRFAGALRSVQAAVADIRARNSREGRPMPSVFARLDFDFADTTAPVPEPHPGGFLAKVDAVVPMTVLAAGNVLWPFEMTIPEDKWRGAMRNLTAELGLGNQFATDVFDAAKAVKGALGNGPNWMKIGAIGVGAAALVFATGGLVLAAGAGLAGAAAITSALASFGPGGMIGGLLTAGTLVGAGGGGIAFGLASSGTDAATLEAIVVQQLSAEVLRKKQHLEPDEGVWTTLVQTEIEVRRQLERLDEFSDPNAPSIKDLKRKVELLERALRYLANERLQAGYPIGMQLG